MIQGLKSQQISADNDFCQVETVKPFIKLLKISFQFRQSGFSFFRFLRRKDCIRNEMQQCVIGLSCVRPIALDLRLILSRKLFAKLKPA